MTAALQQVQSTPTELDLSANVCSEAGLHVEFLNELQPVSGQLALREFPRLRKLKAPIATLHRARGSGGERQKRLPSGGMLSPGFPFLPPVSSGPPLHGGA